MSYNGVLLLSFTAGLLTENLLFARGFGIDGVLNHTQNTSRIIIFGLYAYTTAIPACSLAWLIKNKWKVIAIPEAIQPFVWLSCLCLVYIAHRSEERRVG